MVDEDTTTHAPEGKDFLVTPLPIWGPDASLTRGMNRPSIPRERPAL
jgi:hypothetical protein